MPRFILFLLLASCTACTHTDKKRFLFEAELTAAHSFPIHEAFYPFGVHIQNDYLILSTLNNPGLSPDYFFQAYRLSDFTYAGSFGRRGRGPDEWLNPEVVHSASNAPCLYLWDVSSRQSTAVIHKMALDSTMQLKATGAFSVDKGHGFMNHPVISGDSLLVFDEFTPEPAVRVHHLHQGHPVITWKYGVSSLKERFFDENMGNLKANDSCVAFLYRYKDRIDFMDWNLKLKKRIDYQKGKPVIHTDRSESDLNVTFYGTSFFGEHFLYALYSGMSSKETRANSFTGYTLEVYDPNGTPVCRYAFLKPPPVTFAVDERTFNLYGYRGADGMEDSVFVYRLAGLKEYLTK